MTAPETILRMAQMAHTLARCGFDVLSISFICPQIHIQTDLDVPFPTRELSIEESENYIHFSTLIDSIEVCWLQKKEQAAA